MKNQVTNIACINSLYISAIFKIFFLLVCGYGLCLHISLVNVDYNIRMFSYFTVLSNSFCFIMTLIFIIKEVKYKIKNTSVNRNVLLSSVYTQRYAFFKGMSLMAILITFLIYHFMVAKYKYPLLYNNILTLPTSDLIAHYTVPLLYILDWLLFQPKNLNTIKSPIYWTSYPLVYLATIMFRAFFLPRESILYLKKFPYFFLDIRVLGIRKFIIFMVLILTAIITVGYTILFIEKLMCLISRKS